MTMKVSRTVYHALFGAVLTSTTLPTLASELLETTPSAVVATGSARAESDIRAPLSIVVYPGDGQVREQLLAADAVVDTTRTRDIRAAAATAQR